MSNVLFIKESIFNDSIVIVNPPDDGKARCASTIIGSRDLVFFVLLSYTVYLVVVLSMNNIILHVRLSLRLSHTYEQKRGKREQRDLYLGQT